MTSKPTDLDLSGLRMTLEDREAQHRALVYTPMSFAEYLVYLEQFTWSADQLRARQGPRGPERFRL